MTCLLPLPSLPHGAQVSQHHGILDEGANRWSNPHVSSLSLHSLMELRSVNSMGSWMRGPTGAANHMSPPSTFTPHEAQVSQQHGILDEGSTGGANHMSTPSTFTPSWSSGQSIAWDPAWMRGPTGGANDMSPPSTFTPSWSSGQSIGWDPG